MDGISYVSNQVQHMTGPRQTANIRITDVRFARMIKQAGEKVITHCRRVRRVKTKLNGRSPDSNSTKLDVMYITHAMHAAMAADNIKNKGVVKAARECGWLSHRPTIDGLETYHGSDWDMFPLGSSRLSTDLIAQRLTLVPANGCPLPPDFRVLRGLRRRRHLRRSRGVDRK